MPLRGSNLREVSNNESPVGSLEGKLRDAVRHGIAVPSDGPVILAPQVCTLGVHDDAFSKLDVLVNAAAFPSQKIQPGTRLRIVAHDVDSPRQPFKRRPSEHGRPGQYRRNSARNLDVKSGDISYVFVVEGLPTELLARHPNLEISISQRIASALGFKNRSQATVTPLDEDAYSASHVEIAFRDAYLTRADMWRLVVSELAGKSMYKGQKVTFMNTIKAQVKAIYHRGVKQQSAFFGSDTKPVFRSESARYVLFIQMSREMWGFDTDGTGDIMFHKVVNGFLPELFRRWDEIGAHHLVSIILFTRMEYAQPLVASLEPTDGEPGVLHSGYNSYRPHHKDFYRVLVSDMASGQWAAILEQLKRDFKTFLRDVSIAPSNAANSTLLGRDSAPHYSKGAKDVISGKPTPASKGNILEAINVASSQFSGDYIDRDLVRTGLSIIVVTPGTGVFEVDYNLLSLTTDVLIENGIGIDLVCLSRMPLHSVPLFKYRKSDARQSPKQEDIQADELAKLASQTASVGSVQSYLSSDTSSPATKLSLLGQQGSHRPGDLDYWHYAIPHWLDVSFWTPSNAFAATGGSLPSGINHHAKREFIPRVKMYEVQMMGIMENDMSNIAIPYLRPPKPDLRGWDAPTPDLHPRPSVTSLSVVARSQKSLNLGSTASTSAVPSRATSPAHRNLKAFSGVFDWIDQYDEAVFQNPQSKQKNSRHTTSLARDRSLRSQRSRSGDLRHHHHGQKSSDEKLASSLHEKDSQSRVTKPVKSSTGSLKLDKPGQGQQRAKLPRQISLGFRGIGGLMPKAVPVTEVSSTNALFDSPYAKSGRSGTQAKIGRSQSPSIASSDMLVRNRERDNETDSVDTEHAQISPEASQPIAIKQPPKDLKDYTDAIGIAHLEDRERITMLQEKLPIGKDDQSSVLLPLGLSPRKAMAPWLTVLNPCNPSSARADPQKRLGRWHHVFPRPIHASHVKWKSLCSPASVPLTTGDFPNPEQLKSEYDESQYSVNFTKEGNLWEDGSCGKWLSRELISARFSHGFQVVLSDVAALHFRLPRVDQFTVFDDSKIGTLGSEIVLSRGSSIHKLTTVEDGLVEVKILTRRPAAEASQRDLNESLVYRPAVRTTLSDSYESRELILSSNKEAYDWQRLDSFIAGHEAQRNSAYPNLLNFWRARYVLIPVERPSNQKRRVLAKDEDNEEEIRLEGIKKLTQLWQKHRYIPAEVRKSDQSKRKVENNPLDIIYRTMKPSSIVAAEMNVLDPEESDEQPKLPDSDLYEKTTFDLNSLAQTIQGDHGLPITNRRWHWRVHQNAFIGLDLTTWLLNNFRDVDSREDAVELGNRLMKQGLFAHVEKRHNFRDGNFFYSITNDYSIRKEPRSSWFGRSVPSTPIGDSRNSAVVSSRAGQPDDDETNPDSSVGKQKLGAELSRSLIYDVDHRHRSYRPELMILHYDRISSADDCYHLRIDWMNVTPKLIEDAIANWASLAERNGLRLVELPIAEACKINDFHPFRGPYIIKLAKQPPDTAPQIDFDAVSLLAKPSSRHMYQEAILRKFNFVLDLEAASDYPASMDVSYSWGKPDYQYSQYISRTGVILAQITTEGDFLLLANRLYNSRSSGMIESQRNQRNTQPEAEHHHSPARQAAANHLTSPRGSPFPSPRVGAVPDVGPGTAKMNAITPEKIKDELEAFCSDATQLEQFYEEIKKQATMPVPITPMLDGAMMTLAPPPVLSLRDDAMMLGAGES